MYTLLCEWNDQEEVDKALREPISDLEEELAMLARLQWGEVVVE